MKVLFTYILWIIFMFISSLLGDMINFNPRYKGNMKLLTAHLFFSILSIIYTIVYFIVLFSNPLDNSRISIWYCIIIVIYSVAYFMKRKYFIKKYGQHINTQLQVEKDDISSLLKEVERGCFLIMNGVDAHKYALADEIKNLPMYKDFISNYEESINLISEFYNSDRCDIKTSIGVKNLLLKFRVMLNLYNGDFLFEDDINSVISNILALGFTIALLKDISIEGRIDFDECDKEEK